jgi:hypothetical protein
MRKLITLVGRDLIIIARNAVVMRHQSSSLRRVLSTNRLDQKRKETT